MEFIYIDRPPRIQPELPLEEVEIPKPPDQEEDGFARLIQVALPLVTIIGYVLIGTMGGVGRSPLFMSPMALSVVASVGFSIYSYRRDKQRRYEIQKAYAEHLIELNKEMHMYHDMQRRFYGYNYPAADSIWRLVQNARLEAEKEERSLRAEARLWERRVSDDDFGVIRLGMGTLPSTVTYALNEAENLDNPLVRDALKLVHDSRQVTDIPVILSVRQPETDQLVVEGKNEEKEAQTYRTPVTHALGIAGKKQQVYPFVRAMLGHFVTFHAPMDAKLYILGLAESQPEWRWTDLLPHAQGDEQGRLRCFVNPTPAHQPERPMLEDTESELDQFLERLRKVLAQRKIQLQDRDSSEGGSDPTLPFLLIVVDLLDAMAAEESPLNLSDLESDAAISILLEEGAKLGAAVVFLVPERSKVPSRCSAVIEIEKIASETNLHEPHQKVAFRYAEIGVNSFRYVGEADTVFDQSAMTALAEQIAQLRIRESSGANLVKTVPFLDLVGHKTLQGLAEETRQKWQLSTQADQANWLRVKFGMMSGNKPRALVFSAKHDGVHGMIAGSTGSGKSELLITLITGLAVTYDPTVLNFVLVDYKGGGAFKGLEDLPHCVDIITNLEGDGVVRMFTAIQSELERRQRLNTETETKNIVEYRAKGYHQTHHPYPFLFIIIDEFAEMIAARSEFRNQLESITRLGRAQGVSLILAAQRPSGVTDQMRSNIKFRICLRVETPGESREMLRRSEAAFLPGDIPGRGYLQVGNEEIELTQVAYTGDRYTGLDYFDAAPDREPPELYKAIVNVLHAMARDQGNEKQFAPWPDFLPRQLSLISPLIASSNPDVKPVTSKRYLVDLDKMACGQAWDDSITLNPAIDKWLNDRPGWLEEQLNWEKYAMRPVVGLVDNPYDAKQLPLVVNLRQGHVVIFGASGWGKTTFIRALITSLAAVHSPNQFHCYVLDLGGRSLQVLKSLPHVGTVVNPDEEGYEERIEQILREITDLIDHRKSLLSTAGVMDLYQYNAAHPGQPLPALLLAIDNFVEFTETFGGDVDNKESVLERFIALARQAKPYGVHLVISVNQLSALSNKLYSLFTERFTLRLANQEDYRAIVGGQMPELGEIPGRGYVKVGRRPLSFQVALPAGLGPGQGQIRDEVGQIKRIGQKMNAYIAGAERPYLEPLRIDALPKSSSYRQVLAELHNISPDDNFLGELEAAMQQIWLHNASAEQADWLKVTLGVTSGNRKRTLQLEAKKDGVHGMIAGGTGSGKSELLMTMIVGLAVNYPPDILNFVLVDYKGGGAFKPFEKLPHCVDIVTNLNKAAVDRMFTAINAEIRRRQALNAATDTKDIIEYRRKGLHQTLEPYPHLFVIIDEYAEMIDDNPEYRAELESITRVGRAQGVNLILASQRPKGVTDQMRANIKLRICLRVEQNETSRELLRRPDAAQLPNGIPGRGYIQAGNDTLELIQVSYSGEPQPDERDVPVIWPKREAGRAIRADEETPKLFDAVVSLAAKLWAGQNVRKPWPDFLPENFSLQSPIYDAKTNRRFTLTSAVTDWLNGDTVGLWPGLNSRNALLCPVVGLVDNPVEARQEPLRFKLSQNHLAVFGDTGSGKTVFLRTLMTSLAVTHTPNELHMYVLDMGGRNFTSLEQFPHIGAVIYADDEKFDERLSRLLDKLSRMTRERQQLLSQTNVNNLSEYNQHYPNQALPAVLVVIDNFAELQENYDSLVESVLVPLVRRSLSVGIAFAVSGNLPNNLPGKLYNLLGERITFKQTNSDYYRDIVGRGAIVIDDTPGRGYVRAGKQALLFHAAQPVGLFDPITRRDTRKEADELHLMARHMHNRFNTFAQHLTPDPINILPETVSLQDMLDEVGPAKSSGRIQAVLGQDSDLTPALFDLKRMGPHFAVVGPPLSGKTTTLYNWVLSLSYRYSPQQVQLVLVDVQKKFATYGGQYRLNDLPHVAAVISDIDDLEPLLQRLKSEGERLAEQEENREIFIMIDNFDDFIDELDRQRHLAQELAGLARRYGGDGLHFVVAGMLDSTSDLKRRVLSSNYGLGLRTEQAVSTLRVTRIPSGLRDRELPFGRGYRVKSGQATLLQVAVPFEGGAGIGAGNDLDEDEEILIRALDQWVARIQAAYPGRQVTWQEEAPEPDSGPVAQPDEGVIRCIALLEKYALTELERLKANNEDEGLVIEKLLQLDQERLTDEEQLLALLKAAWRSHKLHSGSSPEAIDDLLAVLSPDALLRDLDHALSNGKAVGE